MLKIQTHNLYKTPSTPAEFYHAIMKYHLWEENWEDKACMYAVENDNLECLKWALDNGCEWDLKVYMTALEHSSDIITLLCNTINSNLL